jgi:hypothetical protein
MSGVSIQVECTFAWRSFRLGAEGLSATAILVSDRTGKAKALDFPNERGDSLKLCV